MSVHEKKALIKQNFVVVKNNDKEFTFRDRSVHIKKPFPGKTPKKGFISLIFKD